VHFVSIAGSRKTIFVFVFFIRESLCLRLAAEGTKKTSGGYLIEKIRF